MFGAYFKLTGYNRLSYQMGVLKTHEVLQ
jgi:hypothetical protein